MRFPLQISVAVVVLASAATAQGQMRFQGMDTNGDGVITRREWRGNDNSFRNQDWNGDGILSGDEVRTGPRRQSGWSEDWNQDGRVDNLDNQIAQRFRGYDMNSDSRVGRSEWPGDARLFTRLDANRDGYLSMQEYSQGGGFTLDSLGGASYRFSNLDVTQLEDLLGGPLLSIERRTHRGQRRLRTRLRESRAAPPRAGLPPVPRTDRSPGTAPISGNA